VTWKDLVCLCLIVIGAVLFGYGSNYYNAFVGWFGVYLLFGGILAEIILKVYEILRKKAIN